MSGIMSVLSRKRFERTPFEFKVAYVTSVLSIFSLMFGLAVLLVLKHFGLSIILTLPLGLLTFLLFFNATLSYAELRIAKEL
jgi:hypothetical protein